VRYISLTHPTRSGDRTLTIVSDRASHACEYCLMPEIAVFVSHEIDRAIAQKHGEQRDDNNLALTCTICNKYKGSNLASIASRNREIVRLIHSKTFITNAPYNIGDRTE
jgi:5-methylcytosine-specific restriction endonuclease McrA